MSTVALLQRWKDSGAITAAQFDSLIAIVRKERFSVFVELNVLLYLGVLSLVGGVGWTINTYFADLGDAAILIGLTALLTSSLYYCFSHKPGMVVDYILYLACLTLAAELVYIEARFEVLRDHWDYNVLLSAIVYFFFAYRFDNRLVLSLALSTLAAWFGVKISRFDLISNDSRRAAAIGYGLIVSGGGLLLAHQGIKKHFLETYLHVGSNVLFVALVSGAIERNERNANWMYLLGLVVLAVVAIRAGVHFRRFVFVVYGTIYGYIGVSAEILRRLGSDTAALSYIVVSSTIVILAIVMLARRFGREE